MRIKKFKNNEYILAEGVWVRNLCLPAKPIDINRLGGRDLQLFLGNECSNQRVSGMTMDDTDDFSIDNLIIMSDGYGWKERQKILASMPNSMVKTIGVNGSLAKWDMVGNDAEFKRTMTFYLINNPYPEALSFLPKKHRYYPNLMASTKTNPRFFEEYRNQPFFYKASPDINYSGIGSEENNMCLDDYRNPICAAISFAWKKRVKKLALFCCDESFEDERPGAVKMKNGLYQYPQQIMCQRIIDKQLYWLKKSGVKLADCSSGVEYENAAYIEKDNLPSFFSKESSE
jgi:hypothetical protein